MRHDILYLLLSSVILKHKTGYIKGIKTLTVIELSELISNT